MAAPDSAPATPALDLEVVLNRPDDTLPYALYDPSKEGRLTWICNYGIPRNGRPSTDIIAVYAMDFGDHTEKEYQQYASIEDARKVRDGLKAEGWQILIPPKVTYTMNGKAKELTSKQKKYLRKKLEKAERDHQAAIAARDGLGS